LVRGRAKAGVQEIGIVGGTISAFSKSPPSS
jgi:hypothetical protein